MQNIGRTSMKTLERLFVCCNAVKNRNCYAFFVKQFVYTLNFLLCWRYWSPLASFIFWTQSQFWPYLRSAILIISGTCFCHGIHAFVIFNVTIQCWRLIRHTFWSLNITDVCRWWYTIHGIFLIQHHSSCVSKNFKVYVIQIACWRIINFPHAIHVW